MEELKTRIANLEKKNKELHNELENMRDKLEDEYVATVEISKKKSDTKFTLEMVKDKYRKEKEARNELEQQIKKTDTELDEIKIKLDSELAFHASAASSRETVEMELDVVKRGLIEEKKTTEILEIGNKVLEDEVSNLNSKVENLKATLVQRQTEIQEVVRELKASGPIDGCGRVYTDDRRAEAILENELLEANCALQAETHIQTSLGRRQREIQEYLNDTQAQLNQECLATNHSYQTHQTLKREHEELDEQMHGNRKEIEALVDQKRDAEKQVEELKSSLDKSKAAREAVEGECAQLARDNEELRAKLERVNLEVLEIENHQLKESNAEKQAEIDELARNIYSKDEELEAVRKRIEDMRSTLVVS